MYSACEISVRTAQKTKSASADRITLNTWLHCAGSTDCLVVNLVVDLKGIKYTAG